MKIGMITQWFDPEPGPASLPGELARELVLRGHDVQVVTGFPNYPTGRIYDGYTNQLRHDEVRDGVKIRRVGIVPSHSDSALGRVANYTSFGANALFNGVDCLRDRDAVWVSNSPPTVTWAVARLRRWGVPVVLHVLDLWPDNILSSGLVASSTSGQAMLKVVNSWNASLYRDSERILTIAPGVAGLLQERGVAADKISYSPLWANEGVFGGGGRADDGDERRRELGVSDDTVVLLYAGAIGEAQGLDTLVAAMSSVPPESAPNLEAWFIGDGVWHEELQAAVAAAPHTSPRMRVLGRKPMSEMPGWTAAADICYVGLKPDVHARYSMPSKVQTTLAMGKPILASVPGDVDHLVSSTGVGLSSGTGDVGEVRDLLTQAAALGRDGLAQLGSEAASLYHREFSLAAGTTRIESALREVASAPPASANEGTVVVSVAGPDDVADIVAVHQHSFPDFFLTFLGPRFLKLFYEELQSDPDAVLLVAKRGGRSVGLVGGVLDESAFFASLKQRRTREFIQAAALAAARKPTIVPRLWRARRRDEEKADAEAPATLLTIAVEPSEQGRGTAGELLGSFVDAMQAAGVAAFTLTTDLGPDNRALGFYAKNGLERHRDFTTPEGRHMTEFIWRRPG